jgi:hypothetical protein
MGLKFDESDSAGLSDRCGEDFDGGDLATLTEQGAKIVILGFVGKIVDKKSARLERLREIGHRRDSRR